MRLSIVLASLAATALLGPAAAVPSPAGSTTPTERARVLVTASDPGRDVRLTRARGLPAAERRAVELHRLRVTDRGDVVRFAVRVGRVNRSPDHLQYYFVDVSTDELPFGQLGVGTHPTTGPPDTHGIDHDMVIEGADGRYGFVECRHLAVSLRDGARWWWAEVPKRCLPRGRVSLSVYAQTTGVPYVGDLRGPRQWSEDRLEVAGRHDLGGRARPDRS